MAKNSDSEKSVRDYVPMRGKRALPFELKNIVDVILMMQKHGQLEKFSSFAKRNDLFVSLPPETVNSVKEFVVKDEALRTDRIGKKILVPKKKPVATRGEVGLSATVRGPTKDYYKDCCGF